MPDLADSWKFPVGQHDLRAARVPKAGGDGTEAGGQRRRDSDLVGLCVDDPREGPTRVLALLDPVLPRRAAFVPVLQVAVVRLADRVRERALRARVDVDALLEDWKAMANAVGQRPNEERSFALVGCRHARLAVQLEVAKRSLGASAHGRIFATPPPKRKICHTTGTLKNQGLTPIFCRCLGGAAQERRFVVKGVTAACSESAHVWQRAGLVVLAPEVRLLQILVLE